MGKFLVYALRIISYIALPIGEYLALWTMSSPSLDNLLRPLMPTNLAEEITVAVVLVVFPILIIFFLHPTRKVRITDTMPAATNAWPRLQKPTLKEFILSLVAIMFLSFVAALPTLLWILILLMLFDPQCSGHHFMDCLGTIYRLISR